MTGCYKPDGDRGETEARSWLDRRLGREAKRGNRYRVSSWASLRPDSISRRPDRDELMFDLQKNVLQILAPRSFMALNLERLLRL